MNNDVDNEWELCKENIQPLRQGRRMGELRKALQNDTTLLRNQAQEFEMQLRQQSDDKSEDQLNVWYSYITWMEQNFPTNSQEPLKLMKRCVQHFNGIKDVYQNEKFLLVWLKLADLMDDPAAIFQYQLDQDIGTSLAIFYRAWAEHFEIIGATKKAGELYDLGVNRSAQPVDLLIDCRRDFDVRMVKKPVNQDTDMATEKRSRKVLGGLKVDKSGRIGNDRSKIKGSSSCKSSSKVSKHNVSQSSNFAIYGDENPAPTFHTTGTGQISQLPISSAIQTENKKQIETIKGAKVKNAGGSVASAPKFDIFTDETASSAENPTPRQGARLESARKPLSTKKDEKNPYRFYDPNKPIDPNVVYKYCKNVIYMGVKEVSFEELKAQLGKYKKKSSVPARTKLCFNNTNPQASTEKAPDPDQLRHNVVKHSSDVTMHEVGSIQTARNEVAPIVEQTVEHVKGSPPVEFSTLEVKCLQPSEVTMVLNQIEGSEFGLPYYESTGVVRPGTNANIRQQFGTPERGNTTNHFSVVNHDVHMGTPEWNQNGLPGKGDTHDILDELDKTARFGKPSTVDVPVCGQMLHMLDETKRFNNVEPDENVVMETGIGSVCTNLTNGHGRKMDFLPTKSDSQGLEFAMGSDEVDLGVVPLDDSLVKCDSLSKTSTKPVASTLAATKYDNDDLEQLRQLSYQSGVALDIFGDKNLMMGGMQTTPKDNNESNDSLINKLKLLDTSDLDGNVLSSDEFQFQQSALSKTPKLLRESGFVNNGRKEEVWAPSPTVNTKDAFNHVRSMFSTTMDHEKFDFSFNGSTQIDKTFEAQFCFGDNKRQNEASNAVKPGGFTIFSDETSNAVKPGGFTIFADETSNPVQPGGFTIFADETSNAVKPGGFTIFADATETRQNNAAPPKKSTTFSDHEEIDGTKIDSYQNSQTQNNPTRNPSVYSDSHCMAWSPATKSKGKSPQHDILQNGGGFSLYTDATNNCQPSLIANTFNASKLPNSDENPLWNASVPPRPVSTPFTASSDMKSMLFGNISDITSGMKANATTFSSFEKTCLDLSTIQERSNEDCPEDSRKRSSSSEDEFGIHGSILNAFDPNFKTLLINKAMPQIMASDNYLNVNGTLPKLQGASMELQIGPRNIRVIQCLLKGQRSATYKAVNNFSKTVSLKISKDACSVLLWDFYISNEIQRRMSMFPHQFNSLNSAFMKHNLLCKYYDSTCVESLFYSEGTLKDLIQLYRKHNETLDEILVMLYAHEILRMVHILHTLDILHLDLRPGNFIQVDCVLTDDGPLALRSLILKGFENSVDLTLVNLNSVLFVGSSNTESYECAEMRANKPWKYQADFYAAAATIHMLVFGTHMNTYSDPTTKVLRMCNSPRRDWNFELWGRLFSTLINATQKDILPPLINELANELSKPQNIKLLDDAIMKKSDILMEDD